MPWCAVDKLASISPLQVEKFLSNGAAKKKCPTFYPSSPSSECNSGEMSKAGLAFRKQRSPRLSLKGRKKKKVKNED